MYGKIVLNLLLVFLIVLIQIGFISGLPFYFTSLNLILIVLVFVLENDNFKIALIWALVAGFLLDMYYFKTFGVYFLGLFLALLLMNFLLIHFFTNRSLYSFLALIFFGHLAFRIFYYIYKLFLNLIFHINFVYNFNLIFFKNELVALGMNIIMVIISFYIFSFLTSSFSPVFLSRGKKK